MSPNSHTDYFRHMIQSMAFFERRLYYRDQTPESLSALV
jgi:hypothetical protein